MCRGGAEEPIDLKGPFDRLARFIHDSKADPQSCAPATLYPGAPIPTQCVVRALPRPLSHACFFFCACTEQSSCSTSEGVPSRHPREL